ncbi:MAG: ABC transporter ATP-binding protein [Clostridiales bacterium]|nr:ABC transporter ATP-binding protein [Clostridiales bacterium]
MRGEQLSRYYDNSGLRVTALSGADFAIYPGEFIVVLGPSGSGKSTLLNILGGMDHPSEGKLWHGDKDITKYSLDALAAYRRDVVGFIFQFFNLIPSLTAIENVDLSASIVKSAMKPKEVLDMVGLSGREKHFPSQLSGGEQQRVSIARAIVKRPGLLLCDEPTGALDSTNSAAIIKLLAEVGHKLNCPVIVITHEVSIAKIANRVFYMKDGRIDRQENNPEPLSPDDLTW